MVTHFEVRHLLDGWRLLEGGAYFNLSTQKGGTYYRAALIIGRRLFETLRLLKEIRYS